MPPRDTIARILRVNHGGEHGAIAIYRAQIATARWRCPELTPFLVETLSHELEHRRRFRDLMAGRNARPCRAMWTWALGGAMLGAFTGLLGRQAVLICTEAVERTVHRHLDDQLAFLGPRDAELSETIRQIGEQEEGHLAHAVAERRPTQALGRALDAVISAATNVLIWLSTQGDSARLARELAAARRTP